MNDTVARYKSFAGALLREPDNPEHLINQFALLINDGDRANSKHYLHLAQRAYNAAPNDINAVFSYGSALQRAGKFASAKDVYRWCVDHAPEEWLTRSLHHLGVGGQRHQLGALSVLLGVLLPGGGLLHTHIASCALFSAISGSTIATTAMLGSLLLPQMLQRNYEPKTAMGPILAIGGVDILIPPSGLAVLLGSLAGISISGLLVGGIVPGLILSALFIGYVLIRCWLNPALAPQYDDGKPQAGNPWLRLVVTILPLIGVFAIVVISMTGGWATPTESSALGAVATVLLAACYRCLTPQNLWKSLLGTVSISGSLLFIIVGATTFAQLLSFSGATAGLVAVIESSQFSQTTILIGMLGILLILGFFIDQTSIMMITLPFYMPLLRNMGVDLIWFGILYLLCMQIGLLTPPFGLLLFVLKGVAPPGISIGMIYRAALPYVWLTMLMMALIFAIPMIVTAFVPG